MSDGEVISLKATRVYKLAFSGGAAGLVMLVTAIKWHPLGGVATNIVPALILVGLWFYFLRRGGIFTVADEVVEWGDHLGIRSGGDESPCRIRISTAPKSWRCLGLGAYKSTSFNRSSSASGYVLGEFKGRGVDDSSRSRDR